MGRTKSHGGIRGSLIAVVLALAACGDDADKDESGKDAAAGEGNSTGDSGTSNTNGGAETGDPDDSCSTGSGGGEASSGACLIANYAGTYNVTASSGSHARGTITIADDGTIDYDAALQFPAQEFQGVYDRLECCMRISVEMNPRADNDATLGMGARHRVDVFTSTSELAAPVVRFEYYPNWPSEVGKVALEVN
jgi:hypothetical protein